MAFIKTGDAETILGHFDCDGELQVCPKCGNKLTIIAIDGENNQLICEDCDIDEDLSYND
jgi:hypothetical protein